MLDDFFDVPLAFSISVIKFIHWNAQNDEIMKEISNSSIKLTAQARLNKAHKGSIF
jgi:hypothetical protein